MLKLFLWLKYLRKKKIVFLSIAAVALSVALLIIIASLFSGYIEAVEKTGREAFGDVYLNPWVQIPETTELIERIESLPGVEAAAAFVDYYGLLYLGKGNVKAVKVLGIDPVRYSELISLKDSLLRQKDKPGEPSFGEEPDKTAGFVGIGVLIKPDEKTDEYDFEQVLDWLGKEVVLTTGALVEKKSDNLEGKVEQRIKHRTLKFTISDIVFRGIYFLDSTDIYLPMDTVRELIGWEGTNKNRYRYEAIKIKVSDGVEPEQMLEPIRKVWEKFAREQNFDENLVTSVWVRTSQQIQEHFLAEVRKQMGVLMLIFGIVCSAVVLLVFCIFYMIVMTRQKDVAIIKSCGTSSSSVALIFVGFGVCVGIIGSAFGMILGWAVTKNINIIEYWIRVIFGLKLWKSSVYVFDKIPDKIDFSTTFWVVVFSCLAACVGALIPALVAARTKPVDILRYE